MHIAQQVMMYKSSLLANNCLRILTIIFQDYTDVPLLTVLKNFSISFDGMVRASFFSSMIS